jgi:two-component system, cell cycle sensor histidine kinase and response regulator CckA
MIFPELKSMDSPENDAVFQMIAERIPDSVFLLDLDDEDTPGRILYANSRACQEHGYTLEEIKACSIRDLDDPQTASQAPERLKSLLSGETFVFEGGHLRKDGTRFPVEVTAKLLDSNRHRIVLAIDRDITRQRRAEDSARVSRHEFESLVNAVDGIVWEADPETMQFRFVSQQAERILGYPVDQWLSLPTFWADHLHPDDQGAAIAASDSAMARKSSHQLDYRMLAADGRSVWIQDRVTVEVRDGQTVRLNGIMVDMTQSKQGEETRIKLSKLESLGLLAGGIAHDFNNLLTGILGNISIAQSSAGENSPGMTELDAAEHAALRAKDLTYQLLTFAKGGDPVKEMTDLGDIIAEAAAFSFHGSNTRCVLEVADDLWPVNVDAGQIRQAIQNLAINARQAMPDGGVFRVKASNINLEAHAAISELSLPEGAYVKMTFSDLGSGIPQDQQSNIFDPYYTTKKDGSGLGLATTHSIVRQHDGAILVQSALNEGTTFDVYLPAFRAISSPDKPEDLEPIESVEGEDRGRILVLDDEEMVRSLINIALSKYGYEVDLQSDGRSAIQAYRQAVQTGCPYDLVILDLTVPGGMGGKEVMAELLQIDSDVNAIVSSGYHNDPVMANYRDFGFSGIVAKPYKVRELVRTVQQTIRQSVQ